MLACILWTVVFTPADASLYEPATAEVQLTVGKATPLIDWSSPASIIYGTALDVTQLNASSLAPGDFEYTPDEGTVLSAGESQQLQATLPESSNFLAATATVEITVTKAPLTITADDQERGAGFENPELTATYSGFVNGDTELDSLPSLSTSAEILSPPGNYPINVEGGENSNYEITRIQGTLTIAPKMVPEISWSNPASIVYGTSLGIAQLDATANIEGTFAYDPLPGSILSAGDHVLNATFSPTEAAKYANVEASVTLTVLKADPVITWSSPAPITYGTAIDSSQLNATTSAPGTLTYIPAAGTVLDAGTAQQLHVSIQESDNYNAATSTVLISVSQAPLSVVADDKQRKAGYENPEFTFQYSGLVNGDSSIDTLPICNQLPLSLAHLETILSRYQEQKMPTTRLPTSTEH